MSWMDEWEPQHKQTLGEVLNNMTGSIDDATPEEWDKASKSALKTQVGGSHYKDTSIQPIEYIMANNLDFCEGNIVKYTTRHHTKGGAEDIRKVIHYAELLLELKYGEKK